MRTLLLCPLMAEGLQKGEGSVTAVYYLFSLLSYKGALWRYWDSEGRADKFIDFNERLGAVLFAIF